MSVIIVMLCPKGNITSLPIQLSILIGEKIKHALYRLFMFVHNEAGHNRQDMLSWHAFFTYDCELAFFFTYRYVSCA